MRDPALWTAIGGIVTAVAGVVYTYRADRERTQVARQAGYVEGYDRLVDDLQADNRRLRDELAEMRTEITRLNDAVRQATSRGGEVT